MLNLRYRRPTCSSLRPAKCTTRVLQQTPVACWKRPGLPHLQLSHPSALTVQHHYLIARILRVQADKIEMPKSRTCIADRPGQGGSVGRHSWGHLRLGPLVRR